MIKYDNPQYLVLSGFSRRYFNADLVITVMTFQVIFYFLTVFRRIELDFTFRSFGISDY